MFEFEFLFEALQVVHYIMISKYIPAEIYVFLARFLVTVSAKVQKFVVGSRYTAVCLTLDFGCGWFV
jgi:hypothetical protein